MTSRVESSLTSQLDRIDRVRVAREARAILRDQHITLSHGSGGKATHTLIDALFVPAFGDPATDGFADAATFSTNGVGSPRLAFTTDSYVVSPLFFPGGDIGALAVNGTINDLAMSGARPLCLSLGLILEEGLEMDVLRRIVASLSSAASVAGVRIVTGDTKVVPRGKADRLFINTSGVGLLREDVELSAESIRPGDAILVSGDMADHGMAVMLAREALELETDIRTDSAALHTLVDAILDAAPATRLLKDPTRGGLATTLNEIARRANVGIVVEESAVPIKPEVRGACEILGLDPFHIANEGKLVAVIPGEQAASALASMRAHTLGLAAAIVGTVHAGPEGMVVLRTPIGGSRVLDMLVGDPLPRIC
ncbi:MAG TPA: hydrogenase expression/formation protein HypE [Gemmatimonadaceae bacterium]|nr:hydrogenase expression/formation protein HypE [Gemmatimonadaceae bacterium]